MGHVEAGTIRQVLVDLLPEQQAATKVGQIVLDWLVPPGEAVASKLGEVLEEQVHEGFQHGEAL